MPPTPMDHRHATGTRCVTQVMDAWHRCVTLIRSPVTSLMCGLCTPRSCRLVKDDLLGVVNTQSQPSICVHSVRVET
jgi:hypothetical protein